MNRIALGVIGSLFVCFSSILRAQEVFSLKGTNAYYDGGNVGIGIDTPPHRLSIRGGPTWTSNGWVGAADLPNAAAIAWNVNAAGYNFGMGHTNGGFGLFRTASNPGTAASPALYDLFINDSGNVGLGTSNPQFAKLHLFDPAASVSQLIETGGGINSWAKVRFKNQAGQWDIGTSRGFAGDAFYIDRHGSAPIEFVLAPNGNVGLGTTSPATRLTVAQPGHGIEHTDGLVRLTTYVGGATGGGWLGTRSNHRLNFFVNNGEPSFWIAASGFQATFNTADLLLGHASRRGPPGRALVDFGDRLVVNIDNDWGHTVIGGFVTEVTTLRITGGADVAEPFGMPESIAKGSVVVIDDAHPGQLKLSTIAYDRRVAGIVSGANGVSPGIALYQEGAMEGDQNVALSGRVYVRADTSNGPIKPGNLLTTSKKPGSAMRVRDYARAKGAVIGKAMSTLDDGTGMVLVLVSLQ